MRKIIIIPLIIILAAGVAFYKTRPRQSPQASPKVLGSQTSKTFTIGAVLPLSGDYASVAEEINRGAQLGVDRARQDGWNINYQAQDDQFLPTESVNAANKLVNEYKADAVFTAIFPEVKPIAPIFDKNRVPLLAVWDSNQSIKSFGDYVFTTGFSTEGNGQLMAQFAYNKLGLRKVAAVGQLEDWSSLITDSFADEFQKLGGEVALKEKFSLDEKDFRTVIAKIKDAQVEAVYFPLNPPYNSRFVTQANQIGLRAKFLSGDAFIKEEIAAAGPAAEGVYFTNIYGNNLEPLAAKYQTKFGQVPRNPVFVAFGYDAIQTLLQAREISFRQNLNLRDALTKVNYQATGRAINMNGNRYSDQVEKIYQIIKGQPVEVK